MPPFLQFYGILLKQILLEMESHYFRADLMHLEIYIHQ